MKSPAATFSSTVALDKGWTAVLADLIKARLTALVLLTTFVGFYLGESGAVNYLLMGHALFGTALVAAGAAALNQLLEREYDAKMRRTASRPLPAGRLQPATVAIFGGGCSVAGLIYLAVLVNPLTSVLPLVSESRRKTKIGEVCPLGKINVICPGSKVWLIPFRKRTSAWPSRSSSLKPPLGVAVMMIVVPITDAVAEPVRMVPPPLPFGEWKSKLPCCKSIVRLSGSKEKIVFAPTRVIVPSTASSSARESGPVRKTSGIEKISFTAAV